MFTGGIAIMSFTWCWARPVPVCDKQVSCYNVGQPRRSFAVWVLSSYF